jgi:hypothetical protein
MFAVIDLKTGKVVTAREFATVSGIHLAADDFLPGTASDGWGFRYKRNSSLLVFSLLWRSSWSNPRLPGSYESNAVFRPERQNNKLQFGDATQLDEAPKVPNKPTMPFTIRILAALEPYGKSAGIRNAQRLRAFVLLLRY